MFEAERSFVAAPTATPAPDLRRAARRQYIDGAIPEEMPFAATLPFKTPKKRIGHLIRDDEAVTEVQTMVYNCTGLPMQVHPAKSNIVCDYCCTNKTSWYCAGCKRWLCMTRRMVRNASSTASLSLELYCRPFGAKEEVKHFVKNCFHKAHKETWFCSSDISNGGRAVTP